MARVQFDSGWCFDAASAPDERRTSGPAVSTPPVDWGTLAAPGGEIKESWDPADPGLPVDEWKDGTHPGARLDGTGDTITAGTPVTLDDAAGAFTSDHVGRRIEASGASNPANDGNFPVTAVNSSTQLEFTNVSAINETSAFSYSINPADLGYGVAAAPTKSWRFDVELPDGWYTRKTRSRKASGEQ
jgi:hypothetical protein